MAFKASIDSICNTRFQTNHRGNHFPDGCGRNDRAFFRCGQVRTCRFRAIRSIIDLTWRFGCFSETMETPPTSGPGRIISVASTCLGGSLDPHTVCIPKALTPFALWRRQWLCDRHSYRIGLYRLWLDEVTPQRDSSGPITFVNSRIEQSITSADDPQARIFLMPACSDAMRAHYIFSN